MKTEGRVLLSLIVETAVGVFSCVQCMAVFILSHFLFLAFSHRVCDLVFHKEKCVSCCLWFSAPFLIGTLT